jgi:hypothetical protein
MTTFPGSPRLLKGGLVLLDPASARVLRVIPLQYNPDSLTRTLEVQGAGAEGGDRSEALRLTGPPRETIKLEAELDATDRLEGASPGDPAEGLSLHPQLAALETVLYPSSGQVREHQALAQAGQLEIAPKQALLTLFIWSAQRILPVRITEFSVTEEAFDPFLNPIRAKVSLGMRVLDQNDLGFDHKGTDLFGVYHRQKESLAARFEAGGLSTTFGIKGIP